MPVSNLTLMRATALFSAIGLAVLLAMVALSFWMLERTRASTEEVLQTREIRSSLADLLSVVQDAETGQRGYLLTGEQRYLAPYEDAVANAGPRIDKLAKAMGKGSDAAAFIDKLKVNIGSKLTELGETVALKKAGKSEEALALVKTDRGKDVMDAVRSEIMEKRNQIEARMYGAIAEQQQNADALRWTTIGGGLLIVLAAIGTAVAMARYTREIVVARSEVEALNATLESRVKERTTDLQRANEEIQRFAYIVSHDLRAPLVNVMGFTTELKASLESIKALTDSPGIDSVPETEAARTAVNTDFPESIGFIQSSTRKMDGLINAILKLSREGQRTLRPEAVNLDTLFKGISDSTQHRLIETEGEFVIDGPLPTIISDRLALEQVFGNLVDNAIKYRAKGRPPRIDVRVRPDRGGTLLIEIADNGRGIGPEDHERVFDLFRRAGAQDQAGEGIGLAHVRALVRRLGGQITLTSELGIGTTFRVRLPRHLKIQAQTEQAGELRG